MRVRKTGSILLCLALLLALAPALATEAEAAPSTLIIGCSQSVDVNEYHSMIGEGQDIPGASGKASFDGDRTLTLNGYRLQDNQFYYDADAKISATIYCIGDLTLLVNGSSYLSDPNQGGCCGVASSKEYGIYVNGNLTIKNVPGENGSLYVGAFADASQLEAAGIYCTGSLTIENNTTGSVTVSAVGSAVTGASGKSCGVYVGSAYTGPGLKMSSGTLNATGGTVSGTSGKSCGVYATYSGVDLDNCTLNATGGTASGASAESHGLYGSHSNTNVDLDNCTLYATGGTASGSNGKSCGLQSQGALSMNSGTFSAKGGKATLSTGSTFGLNAIGGMSMSGGTLNAVGDPGGSNAGCYTAGIRLNSLSQSGGTINAKSNANESDAASGTGNRYGIYAYGTQVAPTGGTLIAQGGSSSISGGGNRVYAPTIYASASYGGSGKAVVSAYDFPKYVELVTDRVAFKTSSMTYNGSAKTPTFSAMWGSAPTVSYTGTTAGGAAYNSSEAPTEAGRYRVTVSYTSPRALSGYTDFTVAQRSITITAKNQTIRQNASPAAGASQVEFTSGSLLSGHTLDSITLTLSPNNTATPGPRTITPSAAVIKSGSTTVTSNYAITYIGNTATVQQTTSVSGGVISNGTLYYTTTDIPAGAILIAAWYDADGKMLGCTVETNVLASGSIEVGTNAARYKLMLVNGTTYAPLCAAWSRS